VILNRIHKLLQAYVDVNLLGAELQNIKFRCSYFIGFKLLHVRGNKSAERHKCYKHS
jgi:hypothetical protein